MINLPPNHLKIVKSILKTYLPGYEVWAFGSRVGGNIKRYSDLDLAIISQEPIPSRNLALAKMEFSESDLPIKIDLVDWATASDSFKEIIRKNHDVL